MGDNTITLNAANIEMTAFLFIAPMLFFVHACLAGTLAAVSYYFGVTGNFGGGLLDSALFQNWVPLWANHWETYVTQIIIGLCFTVIYFFVFRFLILHFDLPTPGRGDEPGGDKLFTKADYKAREAGKGGADGKDDKPLDERDLKAMAFLEDLGGKDNIVDETARRDCVSLSRTTAWLKTLPLSTRTAHTDWFTTAKQFKLSSAYRFRKFANASRLC